MSPNRRFELRLHFSGKRIQPVRAANRGSVEEIVKSAYPSALPLGRNFDNSQAGQAAPQGPLRMRKSKWRCTQNEEFIRTGCVDFGDWFRAAGEGARCYA